MTRGCAPARVSRPGSLRGPRPTSDVPSRARRPRRRRRPPVRENRSSAGSEWQEDLGRAWAHRDSAIREIPVAHDLRLLLEPVAAKRLAGLEFKGIATEGVAHERKEQPAATLGLP